MSNSVENNWRQELSEAQAAIAKRVASRATIIKEAAKDVVENGRGIKSSLDITQDPFYQAVVTASPQETFYVKSNLGRSAQNDLVGEKGALMADVVEAGRLQGWDRYLTSINGAPYGNVERKASLLEAGIADLDRTIKGRRVAGGDISKLEKEREDLQRGLAELRSTRPEELRDKSTIRPADKLTPVLVQAAKTRISEVSGKAMYAPGRGGFLGLNDQVEALRSRKAFETARVQREVTQQRLAKLMGEKPATISMNQILGPDEKPLINRFRNELISTLEHRSAQMEATPAPEVVPVVTPAADLPAGPEVDEEYESDVEDGEAEAEEAFVLGEIGRNHLAALEEAAARGNLRLMRSVQEGITDAVDNGSLSDEEWTFLNAEANRLAEEVRARRAAAVPTTPTAPVEPTRLRLTPAPGLRRTSEAAPVGSVAAPVADRGRNRWSIANVANTIRNTVVNVWNAVRQNRRRVVTTAAIVVAGSWLVKNIFSPS